MAYIEGPKYSGPLIIDLTACKDDLVDVEPGGLQGARGAGEELAAVLAELATAIKDHGDEAEIHPAVYARIVAAGPSIEVLDAKEIELEKALEVVREARTRLVNNREEDISVAGTQAEKKAAKSKNTDLLAHYETTIRYKSRNADKAAGTRRKNQEEAKNKAQEEAEKKPPTA